jgi:hypothetical protein
MDSASKATLENEFGTTSDEAAIKLILEKGTLQESEVRIFFASFPAHPGTWQIFNTNVSPRTGRRENRKQERQHGFPSCTLEGGSTGMVASERMKE